VEQVGQHEQRLGRVELRVAAIAHGEELEERVELQELDAGNVEDHIAGHDGAGGLHHAAGAGIAIGHRVAHQPPGAVQQSEVNAPGVDANACGRFAVLGGVARHPRLELSPQPQRIPVQPVVDRGGAVGEAVQFLKLEVCAVPAGQ